MSSTKRLIAFDIIVLICGGGLAVFHFARRGPAGSPAPGFGGSGREQAAVEGSGGLAGPGASRQGSAASGSSSSSAVAGASTQPSDPPGYGRTPPVKADANVQVASAAAAIKSKSHPERLSVLANPEPFDPRKYKADPHAYLDVAEPGRVFQTKQPGAGVPRVSAASPLLQRVEQGRSVTLSVSAVAGMPVTFTSFDLGRFGNQLTTQTVEADDSGVASVQFFGMPGTINDVKILAASPVAAGQVRFVVNVLLPRGG